MRLSGTDIQSATGGCWHGSVPNRLNAVTTDSRAFQAGSVFLALRGPNFDGHAFAAAVADRAMALIGDKTGVRLWADLKLSNSILEVDDTLQAFGHIARAWRQRLRNTTVIAIGGSYAKTSLRSLLETGFSALNLNVAATHANLNNLIGVPQTLLAVPAQADIAIIECGISETGEMARLASIVQPDITILTGMTAAHGEGLGGLSGVLNEKALLLEGARWCALGEGVAELFASHQIAVNQPALSMHQDNSDRVGWTLDHCSLSLTYQNHQASMTLALPAPHWAANIAFAASIMLRYLNAGSDAVSLQTVVSALDNWQPQAGRLQTKAGKNGCLILDDCYNANPVSMQAAINTLKAMPGRKIAILGDMAELGNVSEAAHAGLDLSQLDAVYLIGKQMQVLAANHSKAHYFATSHSALAALADISFDSNDTILIKASRSMAFEKLVQLLSQPEVMHAV